MDIDVALVNEYQAQRDRFASLSLGTQLRELRHRLETDDLAPSKEHLPIPFCFQNLNLDENSAARIIANKEASFVNARNWGPKGFAYRQRKLVAVDAIAILVAAKPDDAKKALESLE